MLHIIPETPAPLTPHTSSLSADVSPSPWWIIFNQYSERGGSWASKYPGPAEQRAAAWPEQRSVP